MAFAPGEVFLHFRLVRAKLQQLENQVAEETKYSTVSLAAALQAKGNVRGV